jgi:hypothetical protein
MQFLRPALFIMAAATLAACGGGITAADQTLVISGNSSGTFTDSVYGTGVATLEIHQNGQTLGGAYTAAFPSLSVSGTLSGSIAGTVVNLTFTPTPSGSSCTFVLSGTASNFGSTVQGAYKTPGCTTGENGSLTTNRPVSPT